MTKPTKWLASSEDSNQPGHPPSLIRVLAVRMKKAWVLSYPLSAQDETGRMPRLIWIFAGCTVTLLVLSCRGSYLDNTIQTSFTVFIYPSTQENIFCTVAFSLLLSIWFQTDVQEMISTCFQILKMFVYMLCIYVRLTTRVGPTTRPIPTTGPIPQMDLKSDHIPQLGQFFWRHIIGNESSVAQSKWRQLWDVSSQTLPK